MTEADDPLAGVLSPVAIGGLRLPHRIVMGAMHLGSEAAADGGAALAAFYGERARAGAGLIVTGGWAVSRVGAGGASYGFVNEDGGARALARAVEAVGGSGAALALQLFHAGRYAHQEAFGQAPVAPSAVPSRLSKATPRELGEKEIWATIEDFARGAARAAELGFGAVEVMGSEGYLVDQFLSPLTNRREDAWGGDPERRMRFGVELAGAVRAALGPRLALIFRMTGVDLMEGSRQLDEVAEFARALAGAGVDALNVGIGWHESRVPTVQGPVPPGAWAPWAAALREAVGPGVRLIAGNRVNRLEGAAALLEGGAIDLVSMSRPFLADPELIARARAGRPVNVCLSCNQACIDRSLTDGRVSCMVNPRAGRELEFPAAASPARATGSLARGGNFAVIGGGPAGLEAARALAALGHEVELFEAAAELGGQFRLARLVPGKEDFGATIEYFEAELARLGVGVRLGREVGAADAKLLAGRDGVVLASGVVPRRVELPGAGLAHVLDYQAAFAAGRGDAGDGTGERVAIVGAGGIGIDLAHWLSHGATEPDAGAGRADAGAAVARFYREWNLTPPWPWASPTSDPGRGAPQSGRGSGSWSSRGGSSASTGSAGAEPAAGAPRTAVTVLHRGTRAGSGIGISTRWVWLAALRRAGVKVRGGVAYRAIVPEGVEIEGADGDPELVPAERVAIAAGQEPNDALRPLLEQLGVPHRVVGGAAGTAGLNAVRAFEAGLRAAHELAST